MSWCPCCGDKEEDRSNEMFKVLCRKNQNVKRFLLLYSDTLTTCYIYCNILHRIMYGRMRRKNQAPNIISAHLKIANSKFICTMRGARMFTRVPSISMTTLFILFIQKLQKKSNFWMTHWVITLSFRPYQRKNATSSYLP